MAAEPIVFLSHFRIRDGALARLRELTDDVIRALEVEKPRTVMYLVFSDESRGIVSFLHAFPDAEAMDAHFSGSEERSQRAMELMVPIAWEVYGQPSASALQALRAAAHDAGATLVHEPDALGGFVRLGSTMPG